MARKRQIHIDVDPAFWTALVAGTEHWRDRSMGSLCSYALNELAEGSVWEAVQPAPKGTFHVQVWTSDEGESEGWFALAAKYGSKAAALRIALGSLARSFDVEIGSGAARAGG